MSLKVQVLTKSMNTEPHSYMLFRQIHGECDGPCFMSCSQFCLTGSQWFEPYRCQYLDTATRWRQRATAPPKLPNFTFNTNVPKICLFGKKFLVFCIEIRFNVPESYTKLMKTPPVPPPSQPDSNTQVYRLHLNTTRHRQTTSTWRLSDTGRK